MDGSLRGVHDERRRDRRARYIDLFPVDEGYGRLEDAYSYSPGVITGHDEFTSMTAGCAQRSHGTRWRHVGDLWSVNRLRVRTDRIRRRDHRTKHHDRQLYRYAILGTATFTDCEVGADVWSGLVARQALIARWTDSSNYVRFRFSSFTDFGVGFTLEVALEYVSSGTVTTVATEATTAGSLGWFRLRLIAFASTRVIAWLLDANGNTLLEVDGFLPSGTLTSGNAGIADEGLSGSSARYYDDVTIGVPTSEQVIINSGESLEVTSDSNRRWSTSGSAYGDLPSRGSRLFVPQAGDRGRSTRIAVRATREDPVTMASRNDGDSTTLALHVTPRYLAVPRS